MDRRDTPSTDVNRSALRWFAHSVKQRRSVQPSIFDIRPPYRTPILDAKTETLSDTLRMIEISLSDHPWEAAAADRSLLG